MIHVIGTTANIIQDYEVRKQQYIEGLASIIEHYKVEPYIVETCAKTDYLNEHFVGESTYSQNKGVNEFINQFANFAKNKKTKYLDKLDMIANPWNLKREYRV